MEGDWVIRTGSREWGVCPTKEAPASSSGPSFVWGPSKKADPGRAAPAARPASTLISTPSLQKCRGQTAVAYEPWPLVFLSWPHKQTRTLAHASATSFDLHRAQYRVRLRGVLGAARGGQTSGLSAHGQRASRRIRPGLTLGTCFCPQREGRANTGRFQQSQAPPSN